MARLALATVRTPPVRTSAASESSDGLYAPRLDHYSRLVPPRFPPPPDLSSVAEQIDSSPRSPRLPLLLSSGSCWRPCHRIECCESSAPNVASWRSPECASEAARSCSAAHSASVWVCSAAPPLLAAKRSASRIPPGGSAPLAAKPRRQPSRQRVSPPATVTAVSLNPNSFRCSRACGSQPAVSF